MRRTIVTAQGKRNHAIKVCRRQLGYSKEIHTGSPTLSFPFIALLFPFPLHAFLFISSLSLLAPLPS